MINEKENKMNSLKTKMLLKIFFSHCNLKCIFCQNKKISTGGYGKNVSKKRFQEICLELQDRGCHNINLVTPTPYVPLIVSSIQKIKDKLHIPIVYNTSSYENVSTIRLLDGTVDIYLADFKYYDSNLSFKYSKVSDYFEVACSSIDEMFLQVGPIKMNGDLMVRGVIVRILLLPGEVEDAKKIVSYLYHKYGNHIFISLMNQYTPLEKYPYPNLNRTVKESEYDELVNYSYDLGVRCAFIQEGETQKDSFIPNFSIKNL